MNLARIEWKQMLMTLAGLLLIPFGAQAAQAPKPAAPPPAAATAKVAFDKLPKVWLSESTKHDFRVEVTNDLFRAEWVNLPATSARKGAYIHTECRRAGAKWVGTSKVNMLFAIPGAPAGNDTKLCSITVRFEVESVSPTKITGHSESLHGFDAIACRVLQTTWAPFTWVPKK